MKSILVLTDFSECASNAAQLGMEIAKRLNTQITFLHLISTPVEWSKIPLEKEALYPETKAAIGDAKDALIKLERQADKEGLKTTSSLVFNLGIEEIQKFINKEIYGLVVMGTHGTKGLRATGSNTLKVIKHSQVPVLAVKQHQGLKQLNNLLIVTDLQERSRYAFKKLLVFGKEMNMSIRLLYVNVPYNFMESDHIDRAMNRFLENYDSPDITRKVINANNEERGMEICLEKEQPDILANNIHGRPGLVSFFNPGMTENFISHFNIPVLTLNLPSFEEEEK